MIPPSYVVGSVETIIDTMKTELKSPTDWLTEHKLMLNLLKTKVMFFWNGAETEPSNLFKCYLRQLGNSR